jgi:hypothetical protein
LSWGIDAEYRAAADLALINQIPGAVVVFHDYHHPDYPGVRQAVADLGLDGEQQAGLYVWRSPSSG